MIEPVSYDEPLWEHITLHDSRFENLNDRWRQNRMVKNYEKIFR